MSANRGIFDSFPNQGTPSPFSVVNEPPAPASPFAVVNRAESPFAVADETNGARPVEPGKPARLPERRQPADSPFQVADAREAFGFEAPAQAIASAPFESAPSPFSVAPQQPAHAQAPSPFSVEAPQPTPSPFSVAPQQAPAPSPFTVEAAPAAPAPAAAWPQPTAPAPQPVQQPAPPTPVAATPVEAPAPPPVAAAPAPAPAPTQAPAGESDSTSIRQIELRAIFGVDREMGSEEILQRSRALNGVRHIARVSNNDMHAVEAIKQVLANLGFGTGSLKLYSGSVPVEFIREGNVLLAVQTDGGFAPGVRETLMLVARELGRMA